MGRGSEGARAQRKCMLVCWVPSAPFWCILAFRRVSEVLVCVCVNHSFSWVICLCLIDLWELFTSSRHSLLCNKCNCKYVSPLCSWHFHSPSGLFCELNLSILMWSNLSSITIFNCFNLKIFFHTVGAMKRPPSMKSELWNRTGVKGLANILCATGERLWSRRLSSVLPCV